MRRMLAMLAMCSVLPGLALAQAPPSTRKVRVAVLELRPLGTEREKAELLSEVALTEVSRLGKLESIGPSDIAAMLGFEQRKRMLGCEEDASCLVEIGGALGADYLLVGSLGRLGALYRLDLKLVDQRKAKVLGRFGESVTGEEGRLVAAVQQGTRQLLELLPGGAGLPPVAPPAQASRHDGIWALTLTCPDSTGPSGAKGYTYRFDVIISGGALVGRYGVAGQPGSLRLEGTVQPDGTAELSARGLTGHPDYAANRPREGTPYAYQVAARFGDGSGAGDRLGQRVCHLGFVRK